MELYVVRHAIAFDAAPAGGDPLRALTPKGARKFRRSVRGMRTAGLKFEHVLTSPWLRAVQTAELLAPIAEREPIATDLLCQRPSSELLTRIAELAGRTAVVGHEPWLSELVAWLAFGDSRHGEAIDLKKGSVTWLEGGVVPGGMTIRAILPPKLLRSLR